ncbi:hypothetical protein GCM10022227_28230 [Streptomyces sedi]
MRGDLAALLAAPDLTVGRRGQGGRRTQEHKADRGDGGDVVSSPQPAHCGASPSTVTLRACQKPSTPGAGDMLTV